MARKNADLRSGIILLVVISLLVLFSVVGLAFVAYAEAQATNARYFRESETTQRPDADPEMLLAYFLGQLIYGTDNAFSALRGAEWNLAENMYGPKGGTTPFDSSKGAVAYTYPDQKNFYLGAIKAGPLEFYNPATGQRVTYAGTDGAVLIPSFARRDAAGNLITRRPPGFPNQTEDPGGDVRNYPYGPGTYIPGTSPPQFASNDSVWLDLGFPVLKAGNGQKYKPLFAALIVDLDNKLNVNLHGNMLIRVDNGATNGMELWATKHLSRHGFGPWEINPEHVLTVKDSNYNGRPLSEARRLLIGDRNQWGGVSNRGRYDLRGYYNGAPWGEDWHRLDEKYMIRGPFYNPIDGDATYPVPNGTAFPGNQAGIVVPSYSSFPWYSRDFDNSPTWPAGRNHPLNFNLFSPQTSYYGNGRGRTFDAWELEALLRFGDTGSPALLSRLFKICPQSFGNPVARRLVTTHSFDYDRPGIPPQLLQGPNILTQRVNLNRDLPRGAMGNRAQDGRTGPGSYPDLIRYNVFNPTTSGNTQLSTGKIADWDVQQFIQGTRARQDFAKDLFDMLLEATGAPKPATLQPTDAAFNSVRQLAQLAVNMVDYIDVDDFMTPFAWYKPNAADPTTWQWVYGSELPRIVVNEVYADVINDPADPKTGGRATMPYRVRFWIELNNPLFDRAFGGQTNPRPHSEAARARLRVPLQNDPWTVDYTPYHIIITTKDGKIRNPDNTRGDPDPAVIKTEVRDKDFTWTTTDGQGNPYEPLLVSWGKKFAPWQDEINVVQPMNAYPRGVNEDNYGYYLLGPKDDLPGSDANRPKATMRVKEDTANKKGLVYTVPQTQDPGQLPEHSVVLRRLCCPGRPPDPNPGSPTYNPYVTVDYIEGIKINDGVQADSAGSHAGYKAADKRWAIGRSQPYAAHSSQLVPQKPAQAKVDQPQQTFFEVNVQVVDPQDPTTMETPGKEKTNPPNTPPPNGQLQGFPNDWLCFADRPLISPVELLLVSQYAPHELTQQFVQGPNNNTTGEPSKKHQHLANWYDPQRPLYRLFDFVSTTPPLQWVAVGGRVPGRININTVWDREIFRALADPQPSNFFYDPALVTIDQIYDKMVAIRSPQLAPGPNDRPFTGMGGGMSIDETFFRPDPVDPNPNTDQKRRLFEPVINPNVGYNRNHPFVKQELLRKLFNNVTTRSNVFAVWLTVGFFEVIDEAAQPPVLGAEVGRAEGRHVRRRMFAIVDRSLMTIATTVDANGNLVQQIGKAGPPPVIVPSLAPVIFPGLVWVELAGLNSSFEGFNWNIAANDWLLVDPGPNQEVVKVVATSGKSIQARFTKPHPARCAYIKVFGANGLPGSLPGNPGPQPRFDLLNPVYQGVIRHYSIIR